MTLLTAGKEEKQKGTPLLLKEIFSKYHTTSVDLSIVKSLVTWPTNLKGGWGPSKCSTKNQGSVDKDEGKNEC